MASYLTVPGFGTFDGSYLVKTVASTDENGNPITLGPYYALGLGWPLSDAATVLATLNSIAAAGGRSPFNWLPYVNQAYIDNLPAWTAGGGNSMYYSGWIAPIQIVQSILLEAAKADPSWNAALYSPAELSAQSAAYMANKQATSTGGGVFSQILTGVKNIASALALPASVLALPALFGQPTLFQAVLSNVASGGADFAPAGSAQSVASTASNVSSAEDAIAGQNAPSAGEFTSGDTFSGAGSTTTDAASAAASAPAVPAASSSGALSTASSAVGSASTIAKIATGAAGLIAKLTGQANTPLTTPNQTAHNAMVPLALIGGLLVVFVLLSKRGQT